MKTEYEKPSIELVAFEINDAIATSCNDDVTVNSVNKDCLSDEYKGYNLFSSASEACEPYEGYCYYPSTFPLIQS